MRTAPPIPTTALHAIEYIPETQDVAKYKLTKTRQIKQAEQMLDREEQRINAELATYEPDTDGHAVALTELEEVADQREKNAAEWEVMSRTIAAMTIAHATPQIFIIAIPTSVEREQINSRLVQLGLTQVTTEQMRATMIEELFHQDWTPPYETYDEDANLNRAEDHANFLDGCWMRQDAHDLAIRAWQEQEIERTVDEANGAPARPRLELPPKIISVREAARMQLLVDRMMSTSQKLRDLAAANMDFARRNAVILARMHIIGVKNFEPTVPLERDRRVGNALSEEAVLALRNQVDDASWGDVINYIDKMYTVDEAERKNSDSLLGKLSPLDGSTEPSDDQDSSDGTSTVSNSTPPPAVESETTTDKSSGSTSDSDTAPALKPKRRSRMVVP